MGTINYNTSEYITLAIEPYDFEEVKADLQDEYSEDEIGDDEVYSIISEYYADDAVNANSIIDKYNLWYFDISVKPGYYAGVSIDIELNYPLYYDDYQDKRRALKESTQLKKCLIDLAGVGFLECWPGWCTKYFGYDETLTAIKEAINTIREDIKATPTWYRYGF